MKIQQPTNAKKTAQPPGKTPQKPAATTPPPAPAKLPPLFRKIDWLVLIVCFAAVWTAYLLTLAPDLTLEDSGELCTASFYAGIPHPPGYPFWAIYSWLWTVIVPFGSVAWRVEVGESFAAAMACGLVGLMVSRGSSMLIEGIEELKEMNRKWEGAICIVCGIVAGLLLGFDNFMWKESVVINRISVFDVPWLMVVAVCLLRWIYAPHQKRYLYIAMFFFGVCATIHQTMLCAAMGIEVAVAVTQPKLGRSFFLGNSIVFLGGLILMQSQTIPALNGLSPSLLGIFYFVGFASIAAYVWLDIITKIAFNDLCRDAAVAAAMLFFCAVPGQGSACVALGLMAGIGFAVLAWNTWKEDRGWLVVIVCGVLWILGVSFYFYEPISGMTVPPMQWGYPRTVEGFFHALSRGQYERANPTDVINDPAHFLQQLGLVISGLAGSFSWVFLFVALVPFFFLLKMQKRERAWIICLAALYFCVGIILTVLMNTTPDRQSAEENKVFFTASHAVVAVMIGYGLALLSSYMATHYRSFRSVGLMLGAITLLPALVVLFDGVGTTFYGGVGAMTYQKTLLLFLSTVAAFVLAALAAHWFIKTRKSGAPGDDDFLVWMFGGTALLFLAIATYVAFSGDDRLGFNQVYGALPRIFAPNQYSLPVWGALLVAGTVVAFMGGLAIYRNRAPMLITLCLFAAAPVYSGLSHWAKGEERNHWFGYWFGHDMFTPPFEGPDGKFSYDSKLRVQMMKDPVKGNLVYPEMDRNTILFGGTDPGRFCPTYMIFCESFVPAKDKPMDPDYDRRDVYLITQNALADTTYLDYLRSQYFRSQQHDPPFFSELLKYVAGLAHVEDNSIVRLSSRLAYNLLDVPFTSFGKKVEDRRRAEGVYPPKEIYIPSPQDSETSFRAYTEDVANRSKAGRLQPGEDVQVDPVTGRVQVSGQTAVMMINGLLCRVIFDHNPTNSFYVEESFPLEWMYPYETPFGIIMKINRSPNVALPDDVYKRDHEFWSKYSERFIGNWITYDTSVQQIADWVEKIYLRNDYSGFKGDLKFIRDDDAQKAFSKLRSSQAGMYAWRLQLLIPNTPIDPQYLAYRPKSDVDFQQLEQRYGPDTGKVIEQGVAGRETQQLYKECDFAFKQSFAFCPYSPEAVVRYANFLFQFQRFDDALIVAKTCQKLDPYNGQISGLVDRIEDIKKQISGNAQATTQLQQMETEARDHPDDIRNLLVLGGAYFQMRQTNSAIALFDRALTNPAISYNEASALAQFYSKMGGDYFTKLDAVLQRLITLAPEAIRPEAYYDLAAFQAMTGKNSNALENLRVAMDLNAKRLQSDPKSGDLAATNRSDPRFDALRSLPEFQKILPPK
jgi:tetratricopeptide (TPR) repeat protein